MAVWIEGAMEETAKWGVSTGLAVVAPLVGPDLPSRAIAQPPRASPSASTCSASESSLQREAVRHRGCGDRPWLQHR
jgi:hypothetical protein